MKILNLDQLAAKTNRKVKIGGKDYNVVPMSVGAFVKTTKEAEELVQSGNIDTLKEIEMVIDVISECVPDAPRQTLESLNLEQLHAISSFVRGDDIDGVEDVEGNG
ncbi:hypothetical protein [Acinetobacter brisouii]|uniref:hypothetical protein n=1 Tax=Acinetobacter brisouii TaxID=396323 RepID=UPI00124D1FEE|nr:hypothetical protein [Acinetobacter brisouii]